MHPHLKRLTGECITPTQAEIIRQHWGDSPRDLWAQPRLRTVAEHTRAYIDQLRGHLGTPVPFNQQED